MTCDWTDDRVPDGHCDETATVVWTRVGHRNLEGTLMSPQDAIEQVRRCPAHPMGERYGWVPRPL